MKPVLITNVVPLAVVAIALTACSPKASSPNRRPQLVTTDHPVPDRQVAEQPILPRPWQAEQDASSSLSAKDHGWPSEAFATAALQQLKLLGEIMHAPESADRKRLDALVTPQFRCTPLQPTRLEQRFQGVITRVRHQACVDELMPEVGPASLKTALTDWVAGLPSRNSLHPHFKIVLVQPGDPSVRGKWVTRVLGELTSQHGSLTRQVNVTWDCHWREAPESLPRLTAIYRREYEEAEVQVDQGNWFVERTAAVLGSDQQLRGQLAFGHHYWLQRIERVQRFDTSVRNGLAIGDVNGDGLDDLYLCQPPGLPNRLFVQAPDGTAFECAAEAGVDFLDQTSAALFCDWDNDGRQDLAVATPVGVLMLQNRGNAQFQLQTVLPTDYDVQSLSAADYDQDGKLDLFVCVYRSAQPDPERRFLYRDAIGGGANCLFRNQLAQNDWQFENVTDHCGLTDGAERYSLAASWDDYDLDGDPDLYVANDFGPNYLYRNDQGRFVNVAEQAGVVDLGSGMSVSWGDLNRDGSMDLYVGNMFSSAGQRVTNQPHFRPNEAPEIRNIYRRLAKGNSLFQNLADGSFREIGSDAAVELGRWAWSSVFVDLNNDGWEDLLVANGYITTDDTGDL